MFGDEVKLNDADSSLLARQMPMEKTTVSLSLSLSLSGNDREMPATSDSSGVSDGGAAG